MKGNILRIDPNCTDIDRELIQTILVNMSKIDPDGSEAFVDRVMAKCKGAKTEYYKVADMLIDDSDVLSVEKEKLCRESLLLYSEQIAKSGNSNLENDSITGESSVMRMDSNLEKPNTSASPQHHPDNYSISVKHQSDRNSYYPDYQNFKADHDFSQNPTHKKQSSGVPLSNGGNHLQKEVIHEGIPNQIVDLIHIYLDLQENSNLERRVRASLANLVCKFVEILVKEQQPPDIKEAVAKIDQVVIRKTQNLLTCLFRENKVEFREILRLKPEETEDNSRIEVLFSTYLVLKRFPHPPDSEIESLTKRVLKVS